MHQIGVGALGPVFRTYEPERDRLVAVKAFRLDITPEQAHALAAEMNRAAEAGLFHPSIVEPIAAGVEGSSAYCAEEYVAAESLDVAMREYAPASVDTVLPFITQLAGAIDFARAAGIGHGALHPRDIFITPEEARATGFGVVEALERVGARAPVRRPYSPPERIAGESWSTPADVFSLAAITYELLTGRRPAGLGPEIGPLTAGTPNGWMDALHAVLARAMAEHPADRFQNALSLAAALEAAARGQATGVAPPLASAAPGSLAFDGLPEPHAKLELEPDTAPELDAPARTGPDDDYAYARQEAERAEDDDPAPDTYLRQDSDVLDEDEAGFERSAILAGGAAAAAGPFGDVEPSYRDIEVEETEGTDEQDVLLEREADEAHHRLTLDEMSEPVRGSDLQFAEQTEIEAEADADAFILDVAGEASRPEHRRFDDFAPSDRVAHPRGADTTIRGGRAEEAHGHAVASERMYPPPRRYQASSEREPTGGRGLWPIALLLLVAVLAGLGGGYALWGRSVPAGEVADTAGAGTTGDAVQSSATPAPGSASSAAAAPASTPAPVGAPETAAPPEGGTAAPESPATPAPPVRAAAPPAATTGRLVVRSTPSGAGVSINGNWRGRTPLTLERLPFGRQNVRVVQPGYAPVNQTVTLTAGNPEEALTLRLQPQKPAAARPAAPAARTAQPPAAASQGSPAQAFSGSIYVDSRPRGATVFINGKPMGVTPLRVPEMRIGSHVVRLELADHRTWSSTARVTAGAEVRVTGSLEPMQ